MHSSRVGFQEKFLCHILSCFRCEKLSSCVVSVGPETLGDACPTTPKYLEVHYTCKEDTNPANTRHSPHFPDTELTALWNQNSRKVNIESVLRAMKEERVPITTVPPSPTAATTRSGYRIQFPTNITSLQKVEEKQPDTLSNSLQPVSHAINLNQKLPEDDEDERWRGDGYGVEKWKEEEPDYEEETVNTMFILEVVTYAVAAICGAILIFLTIKVLCLPIYFFSINLYTKCACYSKSTAMI